MSDSFKQSVPYIQTLADVCLLQLGIHLFQIWRAAQRLHQGWGWTVDTRGGLQGGEMADGPDKVYLEGQSGLGKARVLLHTQEVGISFPKAETRVLYSKAKSCLEAISTKAGSGQRWAKTERDCLKKKSKVQLFLNNAWSFLSSW